MINNVLKALLKESPVEFIEENHVYIRKFDGKMVPGTTTITGLMDKSEYLVPWAAKMCAEAVKQNRQALLDAPDKQAFDLLVDEFKSAHRKKANQAKDSGTIAHDWIEKFLADGMHDIPEDIEAKNAINAFLAWNESINPLWLASEIVVGSELYLFGGKVDAICLIDGKLTILDFKTSNQLSKDYFLQLAGYQIALEEMGLPKAERRLVRIPKDGKPAEDLIVPTPYDLDRDTFLALRQVEKFKSYVGNESRGLVDERGKIKTN